MLHHNRVYPFHATSWRFSSKLIPAMTSCWTAVAHMQTGSSESRGNSIELQHSFQATLRFQFEPPRNSYKAVYIIHQKTLRSRKENISSLFSYIYFYQVWISAHLYTACLVQMRINLWKLIRILSKHSKLEWPLARIQALSRPEKTRETGCVFWANPLQIQQKCARVKHFTKYSLFYISTWYSYSQ